MLNQHHQVHLEVSSKVIHEEMGGCIFEFVLTTTVGKWENLYLL